MPYPSGNVVTTNADQATDDPSQFRADVLDLMQQFNALVPMRGVADGFASLDSSGKVPSAQLPQSSTTLSGVVELSTDTEARALADTTRAITPSNLGSVIGRGALAYASISSINNAVLTPLNFANYEAYDTDNIHDLVTNPGDFTVPSGVTAVQLHALIAFDANTTGQRYAGFIKNGASFDGRALKYVNAVGGGNITIIELITPMLFVAGGNTFGVQVYQTSGAALNVTTASWCAMRIIK